VKIRSIKLHETLLINFTGVTGGQTDVQDTKTRCSESKVCIFNSFLLLKKGKKHFTIPFFLPFTFNDHNLIEFDAQNRPKC